MKRQPSLRSTLARTAHRAAGLAGLIALSLIPMSPVHAATLEGRFFSKAPGVVEGLVVRVTPLDGSDAQQMRLDAEGRFRFDGLASGRAAVVVAPVTGGMPEAARIVNLTETASRTLNLVAGAGAASTFQFNLYKGEYYDNKSSEAAADPVSLTAPDGVGNIDMDLASGGGTIAGRVTADFDGAPIADVLVFAFGRTSFILSFDRTDANGEYRISGIPGDSFYISINTFFFLNDNDLVGEYYSNSATLLGATPVTVAEGQDVTGINFGLARGGNITGRITAEQGGAGLAGVSVVATGVQPLVANRLTVTDANGNYNLRALTPGSYALRFQPDGNYIEEFYNNRATEAAADPVAVTAGNTTSDINAALATGGVITGHIRATGSLEPIPDVIVTATPVGSFFSYQAVTGADGSYEIDGLATGSYKVGAPALSRWYDNRDAEGMADPVAVTAGQTRSNIDIVATVILGGCGVDPQSRVNISGHVMANGQPIEDAELYLYLDDGELSPRGATAQPADRIPISTTYTNAGGSYAFECLDVGTYYVECRPGGTNLLSEWYSNADSAGATPLAFIFGGTRSDVDFDLGPGGKITGRITTGGGGTGLGFVVVSARNMASGETYFGLSEASGHYTIESGASGGLPTGSYKVWTEDFSTANIGLVPIALSRFEAVPTRDGIALEWVTTSDDAVGFHVERATSSTETAERLTTTPVTGSGHYRYLDSSAAPGIGYAYWLVGIERDGTTRRFGPLEASFGEAGLTRLMGVFPNPLTTSASIQFHLAAPGRALVQVFDLNGRRVRSLLDATLPAGVASVAWDGRTELGADAPAGIYFIRAELGAAVESRKITVRR